ncbi:unnamed protein product [Heligmosomoides polygyrus]|uniref:CRIB domain-containing protein n=1 Tax=Heligmosomoides polygyrus TaxID=6339 RepID=A0A3P8BFW8_HELPZ|nr:unnamed protein product [Heligmosomoides polygyrus]
MVRVRNFFGRIFSPGTSSEKDRGDSSDDSKPSSSLDISQPYNTVHRIHVGYDGQKFSGLPDTWMDSLLRDISEADQKKNPNAVVTALRFYAASMKEKEKTKFMTTTSVYNPSDEDCDDIDVQLNGQVTGHHTLARSRSGLNEITRIPAQEHAKHSVVENDVENTAAPPPPIHPRSAARRDAPPPPPPPQRSKANSAAEGPQTPSAPQKIPPKVPPKPAANSAAEGPQTPSAPQKIPPKVPPKPANGRPKGFLEMYESDLMVRHFVIDGEIAHILSKIC